MLLIVLFYSGNLSAVDVTDETELRQIILLSNDAGGTPIFVNLKTQNGVLVITQELPEITGNLFITVDSDNFIIRPSENYKGPLVKVGDRGRLVLGNSFKKANISSFSNTQNGGAIIVDPFATLVTNNVVFTKNSSGTNGGGVYCSPDSDCSFNDTDFVECDAGGSGGAVSCLGDCDFDNVAFEGNSSDVWACQVDAPFGSNVDIDQCSIRDEENNCGTNFFDVNGGNLNISNCYVETDDDSDFASCTGGCDLTNNVLDVISTFKQANNKTVCNDFGTGAFNSLGYNIDSGTGCFLDHATDLVNTVPMVTVDANGIPQPDTGSPLIESGPVDFINNVLPCSYKDMNGLGRPQDFDGDGVFTCDRGPVEIQGGMDLTNAQSGLYYDVNRNGEGVIVEMLNGTSALVTMFTYHPNKTDLMWFIGIGNIVGNSIVIDEVLRTSGGVFGSGFNADNIVRTDVGGMSIVFPDCDSSASNSGRLTFQAGFEFSTELENMLVKNQRLSRLLSCDQTQANAQSGRSGSFFDADRSGEGLFVEVLDNGSAVIIFYTYTPDGKQFWFISSGVQINGNTLTASMVYPASTTGFGSQFDPNEVDLQPWGTLTLEYQPGCSMVNVSYSSTVAGYGNGTLSYQRLTQPAGTTCDL